MADLALDFLQGALPTVGTVAGAALGEAVDPFGGGIVGAGLGSALGKAAENSWQGKDVTSGVAGAGIGGALGQGVGELAGGFAEGLVPKLADSTSLIGRTTAGAIKGGAAGAAANPIVDVASGQKATGKNLSLDFLQGAAFGGVAGGLSADLNPQSNLIDDETAQKLADTKTPKAAEEILEPIVGPNVAHDIAPQIAEQKDPNIVKNMVQNDLAKKLPAPTEPNPAITQATPPPADTSGLGPLADEAQDFLSRNGQSPEEASLASTAPPLQKGRAPGDIQSLEESQTKLSPQDMPESPETNPAPAAERPFLNAPGEKGPTHASKLAALQDVHTILDNGGSVSEAINKYMESMGYGMSTEGEARKAVSDYMNENPDGLAEGKINSKLNPEYGRASGMLNDVHPGESDKAMLNPKVIHNELNRQATNAMNSLDTLSEDDRDLLYKNFGKPLKQLLPDADDEEGFTQAFNALKKYDDTAQAIDSNTLGGNTPYRQNHGLTMQWDNSTKEINAANAKRAGITDRPGWSKARTIQNYQEGIELGLKPKYDDIMSALKGDLASKQANLGQRALYQGLEKAYPGQVQQDSSYISPEGEHYKQLQIPYGSNIAMPASIANAINERAPVPEAHGVLRGYDKLNGDWKNLKLGGGGFHSINTLGNWFGQQIASGKIFTHPQDSMNVLRSLFDKGFMDNQVKQWDDSGQTLLEDR
jgi:hypothetical protein